jgi:hypothetical protein
MPPGDIDPARHGSARQSGRGNATLLAMTGTTRVVPEAKWFDN